MNNTQVQTGTAAIVALLAGFAAGHGWLGLSLTDWSTLITLGLTAGTILWPVIQTRAKNLKDVVGKMPKTTVVTDPASAAALPDNKDVVAATPAIVAAVKAAQVSPTAKTAVIALFAVMFLFHGASAFAQTKRPGLAITGDPIADIKTDLANSGVKVPAIKAGDACTFNLFAALDPKTAVTQIQNCVSDASKQFLPDTQAALDSATAAKDDVAVACLTPAVAIVKAAVGIPAVVAADGTVTTPAQLPGPILIFQKVREFTLAGGPSNCKAWVNTTLAGATGNL